MSAQESEAAHIGFWLTRNPRNSAPGRLPHYSILSPILPSNSHRGCETWNGTWVVVYPGFVKGFPQGSVFFRLALFGS